MKLVIDIPEETYGLLKKYGTDGGIVEKAVINGTPLPKGHGRMIDCDRLQDVFQKNVIGANAFNILFDMAPTIIEADTEGSGEE